ncbi:MAG: hypothetical protein MZU97_01945 [Bacillus subtilis]|nr:hypothetical protein [Bacillus subtilis]
MQQLQANKRFFIEFGKIYKRLMEVEVQLRDKIIFSFAFVFKDKAFYRLKPYLTTVIKNYNYTKKKRWQ